MKTAYLEENQTLIYFLISNPLQYFRLLFDSEYAKRGLNVCIHYVCLQFSTYLLANTNYFNCSHSVAHGIAFSEYNQISTNVPFSKLLEQNSVLLLSVGKFDVNIVTDLIYASSGERSANMVRYSTIEEAVFSVDPTDSPIDWLDSDHVICVYCRSMSVPRLYK
jgi:hypothetical protein